MKKKRNWFPAWAIVLVVILSIGTVWLRLTIVRTTYQISETDQMIRELQQLREQTELKVTALRSPRRLELLAKSKFGLGQPRSDQVVHVRGTDAPSPATTTAARSR